MFLFISHFSRVRWTKLKDANPAFQTQVRNVQQWKLSKDLHFPEKHGIWYPLTNLSMTSSDFGDFKHSDIWKPIMVWLIAPCPGPCSPLYKMVRDLHCSNHFSEWRWEMYYSSQFLAPDIWKNLYHHHQSSRGRLSLPKLSIYLFLLEHIKWILCINFSLAYCQKSTNDCGYPFIHLFIYSTKTYWVFIMR